MKFIKLSKLSVENAAVNKNSINLSNLTSTKLENFKIAIRLIMIVNIVNSNNNKSI